MASTSEFDLRTLATADARGFLSAFTEVGELDLSTSEIVELDRDTVVDGLYLLEVDSEGGHEGGGEYVHRVLGVFDIQAGNKAIAYLKVTGSYSSYSGTEWDDTWEIVYPRNVVVVQYHTEPENK